MRLWLHVATWWRETFSCADISSPVHREVWWLFTVPPCCHHCEPPAAKNYTEILIKKFYHHTLSDRHTTVTLFPTGMNDLTLIRDQVSAKVQHCYGTWLPFNICFETIVIMSTYYPKQRIICNILSFLSFIFCKNPLSWLYHVECYIRLSVQSTMLNL